MEGKELKQLAQGVVDGAVFTSLNLKPEELQTAFPILLLMDKKGLQKLIDDKATMFYEHIDKASPRSCNGLPIFFSLRYLNLDDTDVFLKYAREYAKLKETFIEGGKENE